jgi:hypothetical protein
MKSIIMIICFFAYSTIFAEVLPDTYSNSMEVKSRLSSIKTNDEKNGMLEESNWKILTGDTEYDNSTLLNLNGDSLHFESLNRYRTIHLEHVKQIKYQKSSWVIPGAIIGGVAGLIGGFVIGAESVGSGGNSDYSGLGALTVGLLGGAVGIVVGGGAGGYLGSLLKIYDDYDYRQFNLEEKRYLIASEIFPIKKPGKQKSSEKTTEASKSNTQIQSSTNNIIISKNDTSAKVEEVNKKSENKNLDNVTTKEGITNRSIPDLPSPAPQKTSFPVLIGADYMGNFNITLLIGYIYEKKYGIEYGYSNPGKISHILFADYFISYKDVEKHKISVGISNSDVKVGINYVENGQNVEHTTNMNLLILKYQYSFYGLSVGIGTIKPLKKVPDADISSIFLTIGYIYYF